MGKVIADMSMSLDGFIAGPNDRIGQGLGEGGERLHEWLYDLSGWRKPHGLEGGEDSIDSKVVDDVFRNVRAVIMGRRMFDLAEEPWGDNPPFHMPVFVVTHRAHETVVKEGGTTFTFVTDGIELALEQAKAVAGEQDISVSGANIIQQFIRAGWLDEIHIHLVPLLLGGGRHLFEHTGDHPVELECTSVIHSPAVTHLRYRVLKEKR